MDAVHKIRESKGVFRKIKHNSSSFSNRFQVSASWFSQKLKETAGNGVSVILLVNDLQQANHAVYFLLNLFLLQCTVVYQDIQTWIKQRDASSPQTVGEISDVPLDSVEAISLIC